MLDSDVAPVATKEVGFHVMLSNTLDATRQDFAGDALYAALCGVVVV